MDEHDPLIERLRSLGRHPLDEATVARHLGAMATVGAHSAGKVKLKVATAFFAGLLLGGTGLASAGALPAPVQDVAHATLSKVGLNVPEGHQRFNDVKVCGTDPQTGQPFRNHGQYVRAHKGDPNAAGSRCGKPINAGNGGTEGTEPAETPEQKPNTPGAAHGNRGKAKANKGGSGGNDEGNDSSDGNGSPAPTAAPATPTPATPAPTAAPATPAPATTVPPSTIGSTSTTTSTGSTTTTVG